MTNVNTDSKNLEKALSAENTKGEKFEMPKDMEIGFHQGALNTLFSERMGLIEMIRIVERRIQGHIKRLGELGVKVEINPAEKKPEEKK